MKCGTSVFQNGEQETADRFVHDVDISLKIVNDLSGNVYQMETSNGVFFSCESISCGPTLVPEIREAFPNQADGFDWCCSIGHASDAAAPPVSYFDYSGEERKFTHVCEDDRIPSPIIPSPIRFVVYITE